MGGEASSACSNTIEGLWEPFASSGVVRGGGGPTSAAGKGCTDAADEMAAPWYGGVSVRSRVQPGESITLSVVLSWFFPNRWHAHVPFFHWFLSSCLVDFERVVR